MTTLRVEPLARTHVAAWAALFERSHSGCFCRWWHFAGVKNDWLARCAMDPGANRADAERAVAQGSLETSGLVATRGDAAVGWIKVAPSASLVKLRKQGPYRALLADDAPATWSIGCMLVDPDARGTGVARALVEDAIPFARERGAHVLEAYPHHPVDAEHRRMHDEQVWMGPEALYVEAGFERVDDPRATNAYPVYRRLLRPSP